MQFWFLYKNRQKDEATDAAALLLKVHSFMFMQLTLKHMNGG